MHNQKHLFPLVPAILLIGLCSCISEEDAERPYDDELDAIDAADPTENPNLGGVNSNEPETVEVINDPLQADFNGDGFADLAIGVPDEDVGLVNSGAVNVIYGSEYGLTTDGNQIWHHGNINSSGTADAGDLFGAALAAGDFDNDGYADLAIGAPGDDVAGSDHAGSVTVIYGSANGLTADGEVWVHGIPDSAEANDNFGAALTTGDFGSDGADDLAIGVPNDDITLSLGLVLDAGTVEVIYGANTVGLVTANRQYLYQGGGLADTAEPGDHLGTALAAGDFDRDNDDDLAIGVPGEGLGAAEDAGLVHVVDGASAGLMTPAPEIWSQGSVNIEGAPEQGDEFGRALAAGDFDNDGAYDLAIGVPFEDIGLLANAGAVNVIYGVANTGLAAPGDQIWHQDVLDLEGSADEDDRFGAALVAGNFNGDTRDDLAIGSPGEDLGSDDEDAGAVNVIYGRGSAGLGVSGDQRWNQDTSGIQESAAEDDSFGFALSAGDFDFDGATDLAIGVPFENVGAISDAGSVNVLYGVEGDALDDIGDQLWHQNVTNVAGAAEPGDHFGFAVR